MHPHANFPALIPSDLLDARLFATREDMLARLGIPTGGTLVEVGVALGDFSEFMIQTLQPSRFIAIDTFQMHLYPEHWGRPSTQIFKGKTHAEFYQARFNHERRVELHVGISHITLEQFQDHSFDLIYVDAGHDYDSVATDAMVAARKVKPSGALVFNDYTLFDPFLNAPYGVVPAVNELIRRGEWQVVGFALQRHMFCDIALKRAGGAL